MSLIQPLAEVNQFFKRHILYRVLNQIVTELHGKAIKQRRLLAFVVVASVLDVAVKFGQEGREIAVLLLDFLDSPLGSSLSVGITKGQVQSTPEISQVFKVQLAGHRVNFVADLFMSLTFKKAKNIAQLILGMRKPIAVATKFDRNSNLESRKLFAAAAVLFRVGILL
jgi:hypothetical protein